MSTWTDPSDSLEVDVSVLVFVRDGALDPGDYLFAILIGIRGPMTGELRTYGQDELDEAKAEALEFCKLLALPVGVFKAVEEAVETHRKIGPMPPPIELGPYDAKPEERDAP